jgi:hypothetical protein
MELSMAFTSLSPEIISARIMRDLGLSNAVVSALTGVEKTRLGYAVRQVKELDNDDAQILKATLLRLQEIARAIHPFQLDVKSVPSLELFLKTFEGMNEDKIAARIRVVFEGDGYDE